MACSSPGAPGSQELEQLDAGDGLRRTPGVDEATFSGTGSNAFSVTPGS